MKVLTVCVTREEAERKAREQFGPEGKFSAVGQCNEIRAVGNTYYYVPATMPDACWFNFLRGRIYDQLIFTDDRIKLSVRVSLSMIV